LVIGEGFSQEHGNVDRFPFVYAKFGGHGCNIRTLIDRDGVRCTITFDLKAQEPSNFA
jgi:hypothetical protein